MLRRYANETLDFVEQALLRQLGRGKGSSPSWVAMYPSNPDYGGDYGAGLRLDSWVILQSLTIEHICGLTGQTPEAVVADLRERVLAIGT